MILQGEKKSFFQRDWFSGIFASKTKKTEEKEDPYPRIIKNDLSEDQSTEDKKGAESNEAQKNSDEATEIQTENSNKEEQVAEEVFCFFKAWFLNPFQKSSEEVIQNDISKDETVTPSTDKAEPIQEEKSTEEVKSEAKPEATKDSAESQTNENEVSDEQKPEPEKKKGTCSETSFKNKFIILKWIIFSNQISVKRRKSLKLFSCLSKPATKDDEDIIEDKPSEENTENQEEKDPTQLAAAAAVLASAAASAEDEKQ